ncbi:hypothetical protein TNCV_4213401 [Trichonephila clavipes]|nr:hypothetical protein TNCV_4213401 [Trichonephila clavipes]
MKKIRKIQTLNEIFEKVSVLLGCPSASWEVFVAVNDDNVRAVPIITDKDILEFVKSSKNIIESDFDDENEMSNIALVSTSSEMKSIQLSRRISNEEINKKMYEIESFVDNLMLKRAMQRKIPDYYLKTQ